MEYLGQYMQTEAFLNDISDKLRSYVNAHYASHEMYLRQQEEAAGPLPGPEEMASAAMGAAGVDVPPAAMEDLNNTLEGIQAGRTLAEEQRMGIQGR